MSVVVCAPTGAGKTVIAQHAIHQALMNNNRIFYTTPLKALSNQKYNDFGHKYGYEKVFKSFLQFILFLAYNAVGIFKIPWNIYSV